jgi:transposase InsO family protein
MEAIGGGGGAAVAPPRVRLTQAQVWALAESLIMAPPDRHRVAQIARALGRSASGLRASMRRVRAGQPPRPRGRPRKDEAERAQVRAWVAEERARQGVSAGWRVIHRELEKAHEGVSRMLVEQELSALKAQARTATAAAMEAKREHVEVLGRDTVWSLDGTHLGRIGTGEPCVSEHARDRASLGTVRLTAGPPTTGARVLEELRQAARERAGFPLVLQVDNGSNYLSADVRRGLEDAQVVLLISRVHTPTDNPAIEHAHAEVKAEAGLGKGVALHDHGEAARRAGAAARRLDGARPRASRGWHTADELDRMLPRGDARVDRAAFYACARAAMQTAVLGLNDPEAARKAERDAVIRTLCEHGLARRHIGRRPRVGNVPWPETPKASGAVRQVG